MSVEGRDLCSDLLDRGTLLVIPNNPTRKHFHPFNKRSYKQRNLIECMRTQLLAGMGARRFGGDMGAQCVADRMQ